MRGLPGLGLAALLLSALAGSAAAGAAGAPPVLVVAPPKPKVKHLAVLDVRPQLGVAPELARSVTSVVVLEVRKQAGAGTPVVGADEIRAMVGLEKQKQALECSSGDCLAEIGGALGAEELVIGSLSRFGDTYLLDLRLLDSRSGRVSAEGSGRFQEEGAALDVVAQSVAGLFPKPAPAAAPAGPLPAPVASNAAPEPSRACAHLASGQITHVRAARRCQAAPPRIKPCSSDADCASNEICDHSLSDDGNQAFCGGNRELEGVVAGQTFEFHGLAADGASALVMDSSGAKGLLPCGCLHAL
jgi:hypothetical protein